MARLCEIAADGPTVAGSLVDVEILVEANFKHLLHGDRLESLEIYSLDPLQDAHWNLLILDDCFLSRMLTLEPVQRLVGQELIKLLFRILMK